MKRCLFFVITFVSAFGCDDEFRIRRNIEGRWRVEAIRISPLSASAAIRKDSVVTFPGTIEFFACDRKSNLNSVCEARALLLGFDLQLDYNIRDERVSFGVGGDNPPTNPAEKMALLDLLRLGPEHFLATGYKTDRMTLRKQGFVNLPFAPLAPAMIEIEMRREN